MNLIELSDKVNKPIESLKEEILDRFGIIILSEYNNIQKGIVEYYVGSAISATPDNDDTQYEKGNVASSEERNCLNELTDIQNPELGYTKKFLRYCIENKYFIFVDTCSLLNNHFKDFYKLYIDQRGSLGGNLFIPYVVIEELKRIIIEKKKEKEVVEKTIRVLKFIKTEEENHNIVIVGNENDKRANECGEKVVHADRVIIEKLIFLRNDSRSSLFITQDFDATVDALRQNNWHSTKSNALILVKKIVKGGSLVDNTKETVNPKLPIDK